MNTEPSTKKMNIEIWSDIVCPFCFLGKRKFEQALVQFEYRDEVRVIWRSFQLNPGVQTDTSMSVYTYLSQTKGISVDVAKQMTQQITEKGKEVGIDYQFDSTKVNNTFVAHRFLHYALDKGLQNEAKELLFEAYFERGENVDNPETIIGVGKKLGFVTDELIAMLDSDQFSSEVQEDIELAKRFGIRGVPFFVFDRKYAVSGAQEVAVFLETLQKSYQDWKASIDPMDLSVSEGDSCSIDSDCG